MASVENKLLVELVDADVEYLRARLFDALKYELPQNYLYVEGMVQRLVENETLGERVGNLR
jgi:hypothetical protein